MTCNFASNLKITRDYDGLLARALATRRQVVAYALNVSLTGSGILAASTTGSKAAAFSTVASADGTKVAFERRGSGPALVLIGGALNDRTMATPLAELLKGDFTVYTYDRRGRGDSTDTVPYAVKREVEDLAALIGKLAAPAWVFGHSSGAILALEAAAAKLPIARLAVYEPPFELDAKAAMQSAAFADDVAAKLKDGAREEAVMFFLDGTGMPPAIITDVKKSPMWPIFISVAPTLNYDLALVRNGGDSYVPAERIKTIVVPVLAMAGGESPNFMKQAAQAVAKAAPHGRYQEIAGQTHYAPPEIVAPLLKAYFK